MTKELKKAIMNRSKLRNKFLETRNEESKRRFNIQRKFLLQKTFFGKLDHRLVSDSRKFRKTVTPLWWPRAAIAKKLLS